MTKNENEKPTEKPEEKPPGAPDRSPVKDPGQSGPKIREPEADKTKRL